MPFAITTVVVPGLRGGQSAVSAHRPRDGRSAPRGRTHTRLPGKQPHIPLSAPDSLWGRRTRCPADLSRFVGSGPPTRHVVEEPGPLPFLLGLIMPETGWQTLAIPGTRDLGEGRGTGRAGRGTKPSGREGRPRRQLTGNGGSPTPRPRGRSRLCRSSTAHTRAPLPAGPALPRRSPALRCSAEDEA